MLFHLLLTQPFAVVKNWRNPFILDKLPEPVALLPFQINLSKEERKARGIKGREWALSNEAGFTASNMGKKVITTLDNLFKTWKPREKYELVNANQVEPKTVPHQLVY